MTNKFNFFEWAELHKGKVLGGFSVLLFVLPTSTMLVLPSFIKALGFNTTMSMVLSVTTSVIFVLGITSTYAWIAYKQYEQCDNPAKFILHKSIKED